MCAPLRAVRAAREGVPLAVQPQAGRMRHPQQRARDAAAALQLARVAHVAGHVDCLVARGGEARGDVAGRSGRLAPRALGRTPLPALPPAAAAAALALPLQRAQPPRQDAAHKARGERPLRHNRSAAAARLLRHRVSTEPQFEGRRVEPAPVGQRDAAEVVAVLGERAQFRDEPVGAIAAQRVEWEQRVERGAQPSRRRGGGAVGGEAGRRDEGQPRGRRSYGRVRGDAAAAHTLRGLREKLPLLLRVALPVHLPVRRVHLNCSAIAGFELVAYKS